LRPTPVNSSPRQLLQGVAALVCDGRVRVGVQALGQASGRDAEIEQPLHDELAGHAANEPRVVAQGSFEQLQLVNVERQFARPS
jgi:hypothetical protein